MGACPQTDIGTDRQKQLLRTEFPTQRNDRIPRLAFCGACPYVHGSPPGLPERLRRNPFPRAPGNLPSGSSSCSSRFPSHQPARKARGRPGVTLSRCGCNHYHGRSCGQWTLGLSSQVRQRWHFSSFPLTEKSLSRSTAKCIYDLPRR